MLMAPILPLMYVQGKRIRSSVPTLPEAKGSKGYVDIKAEKDFNTLISNLDRSKDKVIDENKAYLLELLTEEIVKRYVYREGLYEYYKIHDPKIKKATEILSNSSTYLGYLN